MSTSLQGQLVTPQGITPGTLHFGATIERIDPLGSSAAGPYLLPGFIDTHVHGGNGGDTMDGPDGVLALARFHAQHGTTTLYPTTITNPWERILEALSGVKQVMSEADPHRADIPGAHLEGPFISPQRLGAQPPFTLIPTAEHLAEVLEPNVIRLVTLAPEIPHAQAAAKQFVQAGVRLSIGHTRATFEQTTSLIETVQALGGSVGFTHLYNAMGGLEGRAPGVVGAALARRDCYAEIIFDTHHVHPGSFLSACAAKPERLSLITDAMRAAGSSSGKSELGGQTVVLENGAVRLPDGALAGSILTLDQALRNAVASGLELATVSAMLSAIPARYMGLSDRGALRVGNRADLVVLDENLKVLDVFIAGRQLR